MSPDKSASGILNDVALTLKTTVRKKTASVMNMFIVYRKR